MLLPGNGRDIAVSENYPNDNQEQLLPITGRKVTIIVKDTLAVMKSTVPEMISV